MHEGLPLDGRRSAGWLWPALLVVASASGSLVLACVTPFAAFAVISVATLERRRAFAVMAAVWVANQAIGYGVSGYPWTLDSGLWGLAIGGAVLAGTAAAAAIRDRAPGLAPLLAWPLGLAASFAAYELVLLVVALVLGGVENFAGSIVLPMAATNAVWLVVLVAAHEAASAWRGLPARRAVSGWMGARPAG